MNFLMIIFLSMGGMPPFLGFFPSMIFVCCLMLSKMFFICVMLLISGLLVMFFYLRVIFSGLKMYSISIKYFSYSLNWLYYLFSIISLFGLLCILMLMFYF